nr:hypothetical protein [Kitasatospora fiedleri]
MLVLGAAPESSADTAFLGAGDIAEVLLTLATRGGVHRVALPGAGERRGGLPPGLPARARLDDRRLVHPLRQPLPALARDRRHLERERPTDRHGVPQPFRTGVVNAWWAAWVVSLLLGRLKVSAAATASEFVTAVAAVSRDPGGARPDRHAGAARRAARAAAPTFFWVPAEHA